MGSGATAGDNTQWDERARLERAAFSRQGTDEDRAALAAFDARQHQAPPQRAEMPANESSAEQRPPETNNATAPAPRALKSRRLGLGVAAGLGILVTAASALLLTQPWQADPFERFIAPDAVPADLARTVASFYQFESDPGAVVAAGPTLLYRADDLAVAAYIELDLETGTQSVCMTSMQFISPGVSQIDGGRECTPRDEFETDGMTIGLSSRIEATANEPQSALPFWLTWHPNDDVELRDNAPDNE